MRIIRIAVATTVNNCWTQTSLVKHELFAGGEGCFYFKKIKMFGLMFYTVGDHLSGSLAIPERSCCSSGLTRIDDHLQDYSCHRFQFVISPASWCRHNQI